MKKFSCTMPSGSYFYFATVIADDPQQAREMAFAEANSKYPGTGGRARSWSAAVLEADVPGPARTLDCNRRDA